MASFEAANKIAIPTIRMTSLSQWR